ncbi:hypothetical protein [Neobacillus sp. CF12]|uniref:hypothetical protein n=1 Tax=Neobacillus sp. CF12 TaxID=3055864 RepID=UPI0025A02EEC|nr:hypothetical protein [Neobacillus sp. CF12]MDM5326793.1 hypothetical protein [Neobacillus sp. CF12]
MKVNQWKIVAMNWRTVEDTVEKLSIVQKVTEMALHEIKIKGTLFTARDFINSPVDDDDDLP